VWAGFACNQKQKNNFYYTLRKCFKFFMDDFFPQEEVPRAGCWMLDVGCWMLDVGCWMLDVGCWMLDVG
jgi:hypothetical protein